jgi:hypothetical protein
MEAYSKILKIATSDILVVILDIISNGIYLKSNLEDFVYVMDPYYYTNYIYNSNKTKNYCSIPG